MTTLNVFATEVEFQQALNSPQLAEQFVMDHKATVKYIVDLDTWRIFDGDRWVESKSLIELRLLLNNTINKYRSEHFPRCVDDSQRVAFQRFINKFLRASGAKQTLEDANLFSEIQAYAADFDKKPTLLIAPNGTIYLKTSEWVKHSDPTDCITHMVTTPYNPKAKCDEFRKFILSIADGSEELANYILFIFAYCLTGLCTEQKIYIFYGAGANGKSVALEVLREVVGAELIVHVDSKTLVKNGRTIREDIARFDGARLATCSEIGVQDTLDEPLVKGLTGGDKVTGRSLYQNSKEFFNQAKIILSSNFLPEIEGSDHGIERRLEVIPFTRTFKEGEEMDKNIKSKLLEEKEGILALLVYTAKLYFEKGMTPPEEVRKATAEYIQTGNSVKQFNNECCTPTPNRKEESALSVVYPVYVKYCQENGLQASSNHEFTKRMKLLGHDQRKSGSVRYWSHLKINIIRPDEETGDDGSQEESVAQKTGQPGEDERETLVEDVHTEQEGGNVDISANPLVEAQETAELVVDI